MAIYGRTWWGEKWLATFNNIDYGNRLPRGRSYANKGSASDIKIVGSTVTAKVQGSRRSPYKIKIDLESFSSDTIKKINNIAVNSPIIAAKLISRQLPESLFTALSDAKIKLFPTSWHDVKATCSCPDWAVPCKHIAAVIYLIAAEIDKNPFVIFELHNCDLLSHMQLTGSKKVNEVQKISQFSNLLTIANKGKKSGASIKEISDNAVNFNIIDLSKIPDLDAQIYSMLTKNPLFYDKDFRDILHTLYKHWKRFPGGSSLVDCTEDDFIAQWSQAEQWQSVTLCINDSQQCISIENNKESLFKKNKTVDIAQCMQFLSSIPPSHLHKLSPHVQILNLIFQYAHALMQRSAIIPQIFLNNKQQSFIRWAPALFDSHIQELHKELVTLCPSDLVVYKEGSKKEFILKEQQIGIVVSIFLSAFMQNNIPTSLSKHVYDAVFDLFMSGKPHAFEDFSTKEIPQTIFLWLSRLYLSEKSYKIYLFVDEASDAFQLYVKIELDKNKITKLADLKTIFSKKIDDVLKHAILADLMILCEYIPALEKLIDNTEEVIVCTYKEFTAIFLHVLPILRALGVMIILPKSLQKMAYPRLTLNLSSSEKLDKDRKTFVNLDQLLTFNWEIALGDQRIAFKQFQKFVKDSSGIVRIFDQYVIFDEQEMQALLKKLEHLPENLSSTEMMQAALSGSIMDIEVSCDLLIKQCFNNLANYQPITIPKNLHATLRPYQERGLSWLVQNIEMGFGSILADDMGLGKTLQVIAAILHLKNSGKLIQQKILVVAPTTLLSNWYREIVRFAPDLKPIIYHGYNRTLESKDYDIVITSYGLARRDKLIFNKLEWLLLVIDEAQNIKNHTTEQTKVIKTIKASNKIAMSGTPVENRLLEYWSIFDFTNKNYLGTIKQFNNNFAIPIEKERDLSCLDRFCKITSPFILRRLKSDKTIIQDLPDKIENDRYCSLTVEQAALYEQIIQTTLKKIEKSEGIERKGLIFQLLNALKQICNHPAQYLKKEIGLIESSGKMQMLEELLTTIDALGEKTLIFTQYTQMGELLAQMIEKRFSFSVPFLYGGLSIKQRDVMVHDFQNIPQIRIMIISLKAGGTGLNLTAANHVIHYDLWWNPAVEAQATDRAYRIGQNKKVMVHRLLTSNTFEERINEMIQHKKELANLTVASGEQWITELNDDQLKDLIALRKEEKK